MNRHAGLIILALVTLALAGAFRLRIDTDILNLLPRGNSISEGLKIYQERFLQSGELVVMLQAGTAEEAERAVTALGPALRERSNLVERVFWQPPARESLRDSARFLAYLWLNSPTQEVAQLEQSLSAQNLITTLAETRQRIESSLSPTDLVLLPRDPLDLSRIAAGSIESPEHFFSSPDGTFRILYVYSATELKDYAQCAAWLKEIRATMRHVLARENLNVATGLTGRPVFVDEIASGMRSDMRTAAPGTLLMIALLFWIAHREWRSLILLVSTLALVMLCTVAAGAALLGSLNVISIGFAAILLGLAEDFGVVLHQESRSHPGASAAEIRASAGPAIWWSAITTASAFALLNLSSLPGLRQLGTLIALGILLGAWAMLHLFLPMLLRKPAAAYLKESAGREQMRVPLGVTGAIVIGALAILVFRPPAFSSSPDVLRPRNSEASATLARVQENIGSAVEPLWLFFQDSSASEIRAGLEQMNDHLSQNRERLGIESFTLPLNVWPAPALQEANLPNLHRIAADLPLMRQAILAAGFTAEALELTTAVFEEWNAFSTGEIAWPRGRIADWVLPKFVSRAETNLIALGLITPGANFNPREVVSPNLQDRVLLSGWNLMGKEVVAQVKRETPKICAAVGSVVMVALWITFRRAKSVLLSVAVLLFSGLVLLATMSLVRWRWNLLNLTALPLLLGMGIDYSIHILTTVERRQPVAGVARALVLAGSTSIIGFVFLSLSSNTGMASLGAVCALGLSILLATSVLLLPSWSRSIDLRDKSNPQPH